MAVNLTKGQRIDLTKKNPGLKNIMIGLGWDPIQNKGGFLSGLFGGGGSNIDCDASVLMLNQEGKLAKKENLIYFGNLRSKCGSVIHSGDNLTGEGDGDDEQIIVNLSSIPQDVNRLVFVVNIYDCIKRKQDFGMIQNAYIRVVNGSSNEEMIRYNLTDNHKGKMTLVVGEIYRHQGEWKFGAIGEGSTAASLNEIVSQYR